jgi:crotonobetainyl-CoA:carnitine CoA-transferase CaiB-like acyl-CoA transferase
MPGVPLADLSGALWAATGILAALLEREHSGKGQRVGSSLLGGALSFLPLAIAQWKGGQLPPRGAGELSGGAVCYNIYETRDGGYMTLSALEPPFWAAFCQAVGRDDLITRQFAPALSGEPVYDDLCAIFLTRTREEWLEILAGVDACCDPVYSVGEAIDSAAIQSLHMLTQDGLRPAVQLSGLQMPVPTAAPLLGEHTAPILAELGYSNAALEELQQRGII